MRMSVDQTQYQLNQNNGHATPLQIAQRAHHDHDRQSHLIDRSRAEMKITIQHFYLLQLFQLISIHSA